MMAYFLNFKLLYFVFFGKIREFQLSKKIHVMTPQCSTNSLYDMCHTFQQKTGYVIKKVRINNECDSNLLNLSQNQLTPFQCNLKQTHLLNFTLNI